MKRILTAITLTLGVLTAATVASADTYPGSPYGDMPSWAQDAFSPPND